MSDSSSSSSGIGVIGLLGVAFVVLKLCGIIDWSWWWVTAPFWGGFALVLGIAVGALITGAVLYWFSYLETAIADLVQKLTRKKQQDNPHEQQDNGTQYRHL